MVAPNFVILTLGVSDLDRSIAFYSGLGWEMRGRREDGIVWFRTSGSWVGLFPAHELAADAGLVVAPPQEFRGSTYAVNLPSEADVDAAVEEVAALGARIVKAPVRMEWGGYSAYFADPDGHLWELCYNPTFPLDADGRIEIG
ncbi:VOC family protein [Nocardioides caldifontis]|uniref:VOC family protein n=1 Tax=Nocardioides caldifontis TaxID=2588938 RepID=UPI0011DF65BB|nr:VOC family protein [Nocardioides caldifontis]